MPSAIATWPLAESTRTLGRKNGETRSAPRSRNTSACCIIPRKPPIAEPSTMPTRVGSNPSSLASSTASFAAHTASSTLRSSRRASLIGTTPDGSNSFTSAATRTGNSLASNERIQSIPLRPSTAACHVEGASLPSGVTRSEEHTSELLSQSNLVCRLLLEKKKKNNHHMLRAKEHIRTLYMTHAIIRQ